MSRIIISVIGKNDVGMAANICTYLAESNINILDITQGSTATSQTTMQEGF